MKRLRLSILVLAAATALAAPALARAHPLGNFTVNHYAGIEVAGETTYLHVVLDLAEIPTFQIGDRVREPGYAAALARELDLTLDGQRAPLRVLSHRVASRPGAGGLTTLRLDAVYAAQGKGSRIGFHDRSFGSRIGWREITISGRDGARVETASVPATGESDELRAYPTELLRSGLDVRSATATVKLGPGPGSPPTLAGTAAAEHQGGGFESLIQRGDLSTGVIFLSLLVAAFWGAAHALTPGHGKALVAGYLVGTRGRIRDALALGVIVTVTHTAGVFALGGVTLGLSAFIVPEQLYPWLNLVSALLVIGVGLAILRWRIRARRGGEPVEHVHVHDHAHVSGHTHGTTRTGVLGIGISAGILPCPTALVVLLAAISLHRIAYGLVLILAFSLGLAAAVSSIGLVAVLARDTFGRVSLDGTLVRALPAVSAAVVLGFGVFMMLRALPGVV